MSKPTYINIDLELSSIEDLSFIADELGNKIFVLLNEKVGEEYRLNFECHLKNHEDEEPLYLKTLTNFLNFIDELSENSKSKLSKCHRKVLDIGYYSGSIGFLYTSVPNSLLSRIVNSGFDLNISIYGYEVDTSNL